MVTMDVAFAAIALIGMLSTTLAVGLALKVDARRRPAIYLVIRQLTRIALIAAAALALLLKTLAEG
jgi:hypothetical protein